MMSKLKLAVIFGGKSSEYSVSLHSAGSAIHNMDESLYDLIYIGITKDGKWFRFEEALKKLNMIHGIKVKRLCQ